MAASWLFWVLTAAIFVSVVLLAVVCLHCRCKGPPVSIRQGNASEDYMPSSQFRVVHQRESERTLNTDVTSSLLPPYSPSADPGSFVLTETESNQSYENPADGPVYINTESDGEDPGYIIVLPEVETPRTNQSRASTPSSDVRHDYENVPEKEEDTDYLNVETLHLHTGSALSAQSDSDDDDDEEDEDSDDEDDEDEDSDEDEEGNYVNVLDGTQADAPL